MASSPAVARTAPRRIALTSIMALALVASLAVATFMVKDHITERQRVYDEVQATVQDLRALVHRTALLAARRLRENPDDRNAYVDHQLFAELHEIARVHMALSDGPLVARLPASARGAYGAAPRFVDRAIAAQIRTLADIADVVDLDEAAVHRAIDDATGSLVYALDRLVRTYRSAERAEMAWLRRLEGWLIAATLALLLVELVFVFRPMARRVRAAFDELIEVYEALHRQSLRDDLTGMANRKALMHRLEAPLRDPHGLLHIDLDHFKTVNDTLGYAAGDRVLIAAARAIEGVVGRRDLVVRLEGDAFTVLTPEASTKVAAEALGRRLIDAIDAGCPSAAARLGLSASVGAALFRANDPDPTRLVVDADLALRHAKAEGRRRACVFEPGMRASMEERRRVGLGFRRALAREEIGLYYQPQIDLASGEVIGLEALARWFRPGGEVLGADRFIPHIEDGPLIVELGARTLEIALELQRRLRGRGLAAGPVAINVADLQLRQPDFTATLLTRLRETGLGPEAIAVEVVERALVAPGRTPIAKQLELLAASGIAVELDDFGTGHASLTHLKTFPVSRIKIDRSFVAGIGRDRGDETIVRATIDIARSMRLRVVAEGIETEAQRRFLVTHGCREGQGYLIAPPLPEARLVDWLEARRAARQQRPAPRLVASDG